MLGNCPQSVLAAVDAALVHCEFAAAFLQGIAEHRGVKKPHLELTELPKVMFHHRLLGMLGVVIRCFAQDPNDDGIAVGLVFTVELGA